MCGKQEVPRIATDNAISRGQSESSHKLKLVYDQPEKWLNSKFDIHGKVTLTHGKVHDYLGMELDYQKRGELKINITKYVDNMRRRQQPIAYSI
jgi:hypothetical protein